MYRRLYRRVVIHKSTIFFLTPLVMGGYTINIYLLPFEMFFTLSLNKMMQDGEEEVCSNQILEPTFSNQVLKIDVDSIEKFINCSCFVETKISFHY